ncbi:hypothetical protein ACSBR2_018536 [Camellia fascicularis]
MPAHYCILRLIFVTSHTTYSLTHYRNPTNFCFNLLLATIQNTFTTMNEALNWISPLQLMLRSSGDLSPFKLELGILAHGHVSHKFSNTTIQEREIVYRHESKFIQIIVREIANKLDRTVLSVTPYLTCIESRVKDINSWLQEGSNNVGVMVICGMGGIGKTTIAKTVYNQNFDRFEGSSFLANVRETSKQSNGLVRLQRQLLSDIFKRKIEKIHNVDEGIIKIKDAISCKNVLVVLDDVDELDQVNAIFGMRHWFHPASKIIITTRHDRLLKVHEVCEVSMVKEFNDVEALRLFSWHAFGQDHPIEAYIKQAKRMTYHCGGLPLALEVLGASLFGKSVDAWENALAKLGSFFDEKIQNVLQISYDSLDDHDKNLFLDIACFFVEKEKDFAVKILDECDYYTTVGIQYLIRRCLVTIGVHNKLTMHQLLRDMGREIIRQESPKEPGKCSRVWRHKDAYNVLKEKTGTETIEGFILDLCVLRKNMQGKCVNNTQHHHFDDFVDNNLSKRRRLGLFSWLPTYSVSTESNEEVGLNTDAFFSMRKLRILQLCSVQLIGRYEKFPKKLRWLRWHGFPLKFIPNDFPLESLVVLDMRNSSLAQLWKGTKMLRLLKILNLSHSHGLVISPEFSLLPNLEKLKLKDCINLVGVHESIGKLERLVLLNLRGCRNLTKLPREIVQLNSLEELILSGCSSLDKLPPDLVKMESLKVLHADGINQLSSNSGAVKPWHEHIWSWVSKLRSRPESICFSLTSLPRSLVTLDLSNCNISGDGIPGDLNTLSSLQNLHLGRNPICSLPGSLKGLARLSVLNLADCTRLQSLPELPLSLCSLNLDGCRSLETVANLSNLYKRLYLDIGNCEKVVDIPGLLKLEPIGNIDSEMINNLSLTEWDFMGMAEFELYSNLTGTIIKAPTLQGLYECGIYSIFFLGSEIPSWFDMKSRGSSMSFIVPSLPHLKFCGLYICIVYAAMDFRQAKWSYEYIKVCNKTKGMKWAYRPTFKGIPYEHKDVIWLSDWKIADLLMEGGDEITISVNMAELFWVKEFGIRILYDEEEEKCTQNTTSYSFHHNVIDLSAYRMREGEYFLCNSDRTSRELLYSRMCEESKWECLENTGET